MTDTRTLCYRCKTAYEEAGYRVYRVKEQTFKGECDICSRAGYEYYIKRGMNMCGHTWQKVNDVLVCQKCGLTRTYDGKILFDRKIANYRPKKKKKR